MSLRFRRSVRLFPGVRLNFSGGGISTTVGVRGASMTVGPRGTYLNAGLPGTGISYRTKVSAFGQLQAPGASRAPAPALVAGEDDSARIDIKSGEVSVLTSPGLDALKTLIKEVTVKRRQLTATVDADRKALAAATKRLRFAQRFIVRVFTQKAIPSLALKAEAARDRLDTHLGELEGCCVEVDFAFDEATLSSHAALVQAFEAVSASQRIWDIEAVQATDRIRERTVATTALTRTPVRFDRVASTIVKAKDRALRMQNASGRHLYLYPGFLMMRDPDGDFALIEYGDVRANFSASRFVEEQSVPSDAEVVGQTWKKANKDGSPDRRFNDNYAIPIVRYAEILFTSQTGLLEAYKFSHFECAATFHQAFAAHAQALATLAERPSFEPAPVIDTPLDEPGSSETAPLSAAVRTPNLVPDWATLGVLACVVIAGAGWGWSHRADIPRDVSAVSPARAPVEVAPVVAPAPAATPPAGPVHRPHRKRQRRQHS